MRYPIFLLLVVLAASVAAADERPATALDVGTRLQLFVDRHLIDRSDNIRPVLHPPQPREVVFTFDAPWEGPMCAYVTVLADDEGYRLYYRAGGETAEECTALALSKDGVHWTRPRLGLIEFAGNKDNNLIYRGRRKAYWESHNFTPFKDANPAAPPDERYKALGLGRYFRPDGEREKSLVALVSADGIRWRLRGEEAILTDGSFDSQNVAFWDRQRGEYVCFLRDGRPTPEGRTVRNVKRATSKDFRTWSRPEWVDFGDGPLEQFYVNGIQPYFREPSLYLGFPMRFVPERRTVGADARPVDGVSDTVLISSRDGVRFDRTFREAFLRPGPDPQNWGNAHGNMTMAWGLLPTAPGKISVYWAEHYGQVPRLRRGVVRVDGFASLQAPHAGGEMVTRPLTFAGSELVLNYATSAVGSLRVEVQDAAGQPLPGFELAACREIYGDEFERPVAWGKGADLGALRGRLVRLRFVMRDADLYAIRFR
jgi:hypothetical protein